MAEQKKVSISDLNAAHPFPWAEQVNFDGRGGVRMIDRAGKEVALFSIVALAVITSHHIKSTETSK